MYTKRELLKIYLPLPIWFIVLTVVSRVLAGTLGLPASVVGVGVGFVMLTIVAPLIAVLVRRRRSKSHEDDN